MQYESTQTRPFATMLIAVCVCQGQSIQAGPASLGKPAQRRSSWKRVKVNGEYGAILPGRITLKVTLENNGSQHLVLGTEDLLPGDIIPRHKHLGQDEIILVQ